MKRFITLLLAGCAALAVLPSWSPMIAGVAGFQPQPATAKPDPAIYGHVAHLGWVVRDVDATVAAWRALGVTDIVEAGAQEMPVVYRGTAVTARVKRASARFANGTINWSQPLNEGTAYNDFLTEHGEGVQHVAFSVPSDARLTEELARYKALGVGVIQSGTLSGNAGAGRFAYLDTAPDGGGITVELEFNPDTKPAVLQPSANEEPFNRITQYAFVVRDVHRISAYYQRLGLGALPIERNVSLDRIYRGKPGTFEMLLGWGRTTDIVFEWIQSIVGPNVYEEQLKEHGEGFHHLGFNVTDMDAAVARLRSRGLNVIMSGGWNTNGYEGRFAYLDMNKHGGVTIELLWNKPR